MRETNKMIAISENKLGKKSNSIQSNKCSQSEEQPQNISTIMIKVFIIIPFSLNN